MNLTVEELAVQYVPVGKISEKNVEVFFNTMMYRTIELKEFEDETPLLQEVFYNHKGKWIRVSLLEFEAIKYLETKKLAGEKNPPPENLVGKIKTFYPPKYRKVAELREKIRNTDFKKEKEILNSVIDKFKKSDFSLNEEERFSLLYAVRNFQYFGEEFFEILLLGMKNKTDILDRLNVPKQTLYAVADFLVWNKEKKKRLLSPEEKIGFLYVISPKVLPFGFITENLAVVSEIFDAKTSRLIVESGLINYDDFWKTLAQIYEKEYDSGRIVMNLSVLKKDLIFKPEELLVLSFSEKYKREEPVRFENGTVKKVSLGDLIPLYRREPLDLYQVSIIEKAALNLKRKKGGALKP